MSQRALIRTDPYRNLTGRSQVATVDALPAERSEKIDRAWQAFMAKCGQACRVFARDEFEKLVEAIGDRP